MKLTPLAKQALKDKALVATEHDLRNQLTRMIQEAGTQKAAAQKLGFSQSFLGDVLRGRKDVSESIAEKLGWESVKVFVKRRSSAPDSRPGREEDERR